MSKNFEANVGDLHRGLKEMRQAIQEIENGLRDACEEMEQIDGSTTVRALDEGLDMEAWLYPHSVYGSEVLALASQIGYRCRRGS
jgi:hypothetical protein